MNTLRQISFYLALGWLLVSCGTQETKNEQEADLAVDDQDIEAVFGKIELGLAQKSDWKNHWSTLIGGMKMEDFELVFTDSIDPLEMPEKNPILDKDPLAPYQLPHPEGNGVIDMYSYKVEARQDLDQPYLNPDSEVIWYRADGMRERLLFMGPSGMFEEGLWLSPSEFLVMGFFQEEEGFRPLLWYIRVDTHQVTQFKFPRTLPSYEIDSYLSKKLRNLDISLDAN